ncbi:hypothetical protein GCM10010211_52830 [Streptomyces albospinus]|uniref:Uncharacterized protein n=1 Tax=Streptomyces albospinus TaxID=285515 RepID=A0ABQ2VCK9_9ACTN|nr:hypothetical protein GCM10010211_52830 [Streptomyces albospinus]
MIQRLRTSLVDAADVTSSPSSTDNLAHWWQCSTTPQHLPVYRLLFEIYAQAVRQPERYGRYLQQVVHDSLKLMENLVKAEGCPPARAHLVASVIVAQARGLQLDLLATGGRERVDRSFALCLDMLTVLKHTWHQ